MKSETREVRKMIFEKPNLNKEKKKDEGSEMP